MIVVLTTITINEFRNSHDGRGGSTHHLHHQLWGELVRRMTKGYSFVRDCSTETG